MCNPIGKDKVNVRATLFEKTKMSTHIGSPHDLVYIEIYK